MRWLLWGIGGLLPTIALAEPLNFRIPAESADRALLTFSRQAGVEVLFPFDELRQTQSHEVTGRLERDAALERLLAGTRFQAQQNGRGAFVITRIPAPDHPGAARAAAKAATQKPAETDLTTRLAPFLVTGQADSRGGPTQAAQVPVGNLDLVRTENDALPYTVFNRDDIGRTGAVNLDDFLRQEVLESDAATQSPEEGGATTFGAPGYLGGSTNLNLRGFGSDQTVILINGLPMPQSLSGQNVGANSTTRAADVNLIPISLVERIEVLPVSSAALYSGNPVGGVINIVLRPIQDVTEVTSTYSNGVRIDAPQNSLSILHGESLLKGRLRFRLNATFTRNRPPTEAELGDIRANLAAHPLINDPGLFPGNLFRATPNVESENQSPLFGPGTPRLTSVAPGADGSGGLGAFAGRQGVASLGLFRTPGGIANSPSSLQAAYGRRQSSASYFGSATYDVFPRVQIGWEGLYSQTMTNPGYDLFHGNFIMSADSPNNPFGQDVHLTLNEMAPKLGADYDEARTDLYYVVLGMLVKLPADWSLALDAQYSRSVIAYRGLAGVDTDRWQKLVDDGTYNPLRDTQVFGPPAAFYDHTLIYFGHPGQFLTLDDNQVLDAAARLTNQSLKWPTGLGALSLGTDYRIDHSSDFDDTQRYGDGAVADTSGVWTGRTLQQVSAFAEVQAPLLPSRWLPRWIRASTMDAAVRYTASDIALGTNFSPTVGLKLDFGGGFAARASIAKTNRFPTSSLNRFVPIPGGTGTGLAGPPGSSNIRDPRRGDEFDEVTSSDIPPENLFPEADVTESAGVLYEHGRVHRFRFSVDFFDTRKSGEVDDFDAQDVLNLEAQLPGRVVRAPAPAGDPFGVGPVISVLTGAINVASRHSQNWNTSLDYTWSECAGGLLHLYTRWAYFERYDRALLANSPVVNELSRPDTSTLDLLRNRVNFGAGWSGRRLGFGLDGQYFYSRILPTDLWADQGSNHIASFLPFGGYLKADLARWLPWTISRFGLTGQLRVNNLFSANLPKFPDNPTGAGVEPYGDWRGQTYSLTVTATY